jgi:molybdate transport system substrate-binding protein
MYRRVSLILGIAALIFCLPMAATVSSTADAAQIKGLCPPTMEAAVRELASKFEQASGNKMTIEYQGGQAVVDRIEKDDTSDFAILSRPQFEELQKKGKIESRVDLATTGVGVIVPKGDPKPDISSVEAFK